MWIIKFENMCSLGSMKIYCHMFLDIQRAIINSSDIHNNNSLEVSGNVCVCKVHKRVKIYHHTSLDIQ